MKHSLRQQLQAIDFCLRFLRGATKPTKSEKDFITDILETIRWRIEQAIEKESAR